MATRKAGEPQGTARSSEKKAGRPSSVTKKAAKRTTKGRRRDAELDARNDLLGAPRKPMGPPLAEGPKTVKRGRAPGETTRPTDPSRPSVVRSGQTPAKRAKKATKKQAPRRRT